MTPLRAAELFVLSNISFLGVDILLAHAENGFRVAAEWIPVVFSALATGLLVPGALHRGPEHVTRRLDLVVGWLSIVVGVAGMAWHLSSAFFEEQTLHSLVYSAPFIAPLSYVGVGLVLLLVRMEPASSPELGPWLLALALGGFVGNLGLSLLDHAQNDFFGPAEWASVVAAAFGCAFYAVVLALPDRGTLVVCLGVCAIESLVGVIGFCLHVASDLHRPGETLLARFIHGAPVFAPLLFADLAGLAAIGLWAMLHAPRVTPADG